MAWRTLFLSTPCSLRSTQGQLEYIAKEQDRVQTFAFEDISVIIADTNQVMLTNAVLSQLSQHGIVYLVCDATHTPCGILTPYNAHSKTAAIGYAHMHTSKPLCKRLWQNIIRQKVENQAKILSLCGKNPYKLMALTKKIQSGDSTNIEAQAAALYFKELFGRSFCRKTGTFTNACLDYGYAIIRSAIARNIAVSGLIPWLGIWHKNMVNAFNLADDLIEPFRPFVDYCVFHKLEGAFAASTRELCTQDKVLLAQCLEIQCGIDTEQMSLLFACGKVTATLAKAFVQKNVSFLQLPYILETTL